MSTISIQGKIVYRWEDETLHHLDLMRRSLHRVPSLDSRFCSLYYGMLPRIYTPLHGAHLNGVADFTNYPLKRVMRSMETSFGVDITDELNQRFYEYINADPFTPPSGGWSAKLPNPYFASSKSMIAENRYCYHADHVNPNPNYQYNGMNTNLCFWRPLTDGYSYKVRVGLFRMKLSVIQKCNISNHLCINEFLCTDMSPIGENECYRWSEGLDIDWTDERIAHADLHVRERYKGLVKLIDYKELWLGTATGYSTKAHVIMKSKVDEIINYESYKDGWFTVLCIQTPTAEEFGDRNYSATELMAIWDTSVDIRPICNSKVTITQVMQYL